MKKLLIPVVAAALAFGAGSLVEAKSKDCPPGLAKKAVPCVPPGLAKKEWRPGDNIGDYDYHRIRYPDRYRLPPLGPGERYVIIDGNILRVREETAEVIDLIRAVAVILD